MSLSGDLKDLLARLKTHWKTVKKMTERVIDQIDPAERAESGRLGTKTIKEEKRKAAEVLRRKEMDKQAKRMEDSFKTILF